MDTLKMSALSGFKKPSALGTLFGFGWGYNRKVRKYFEEILKKRTPNEASKEWEKTGIPTEIWEKVCDLARQHGDFGGIFLPHDELMTLMGGCFARAHDGMELVGFLVACENFFQTDFCTQFSKEENFSFENIDLVSFIRLAQSAPPRVAPEKNRSKRRRGALGLVLALVVAQVVFFVWQTNSFSDVFLVSLKFLTCEFLCVVLVLYLYALFRSLRS
ncbi:MAG: hypothetical protein Q4D38_06540 [Planctomycetia bacterium]|nr:hypothetical protein [Planctomycetia bacterium]